MALITPASPRQATYDGDVGVTVPVVAGESITAGYTVFADTTDSNKQKLANAGVAAEAVVYGFAMEAASADGTFLALVSGPMFVGAAALTAGEYYYQSSTDGRIGQLADITSGHTVVGVGRAVTDSILMVDFDLEPVTKA